MGSFLLLMWLPPRSAGPGLANERSHLGGSLMFGGSPTRKTPSWCSRLRPFACTSKILSRRSTRYDVSPSAIGPSIDWRFFAQKYCKEVIVCKRVEHPNILSIKGVAPGLFEFCMVSQWMPNGSMLAYVTQYPGVNRLELVGLTFWRYYPTLTAS